MYKDEYGLYNPDGFNGDDLDEIASEAETQFFAEQVRIWGNYGGRISRDIVRHVLLTVEVRRGSLRPLRAAPTPRGR